MNRRKVSYGDALLGTILHSAVDYFSPAISLPKVEVAEILGSKLTPRGNGAQQFALGMFIHFFLGAIVFPATYNMIAKKAVPGRFSWAMLLFLTGQTVVMPLCGAGKKFVYDPPASVTYLLAHVAYGLSICLSDRDSDR